MPARDCPPGSEFVEEKGSCYKMCGPNEERNQFGDCEGKDPRGANRNLTMRNNNGASRNLLANTKDPMGASRNLLKGKKYQGNTVKGGRHSRNRKFRRSRKNRKTRRT
jgi:hypothetical protein